MGINYRGGGAGTRLRRRGAVTMRWGCDACGHQPTGHIRNRRAPGGAEL